MTSYKQLSIRNQWGRLNESHIYFQIKYCLVLCLYVHISGNGFIVALQVIDTLFFSCCKHSSSLFFSSLCLCSTPSIPSSMSIHFIWCSDPLLSWNVLQLSLIVHNPMNWWFMIIFGLIMKALFIFSTFS